MHDFYLSKKISNYLYETIGNEPVSEIWIEVGELTQISGSNLEFWLNELRKEKIKVNTKKIKSYIKCTVCEYNGNPLLPHFNNKSHFLPPITCPNCKSTKIEIIKGKECRLIKIQLSNGSQLDCNKEFDA